jgi:hypothetical protein
MRTGIFNLFIIVAIFCTAPLTAEASTPQQQDSRYTPVTIPNGKTLPWKLVDGVKVFHLVAEEFSHEFAPGLTAKVWGYNGSLPGPVIEAVEGDTVRIYVTNKLPEATSVHWHAILLPNGMDGVSGLTQRPIPSGETFKYEFTLKQHGTFMYHSHFDEMTQIGVGTTGIFIIHPRERRKNDVDRDFALMLGEWKIHPGTSRIDSSEMSEFNILTFNGKAFPATEPLVVKTNQKVRIRVANLSSMHHHPVHLHGFQFRITETDGGQIPESAQQHETTVLTPVGSTRTVEFVADEPGDWPLHCHMTHHIMNQMGHGLPNMLGVKTDGLDAKIRKVLPDYMSMGSTGMGGHSEHMQHMQTPANSIPMLGAPGPFGHIDMGGMFTLLKVRNELNGYADPGWYAHPKGSVAEQASAEELKRDLGIDATPASKKESVHSKHVHQH